MVAPIALFVYNRPEHTLKTLEALSANKLSDESLLYIYADGPKPNASKEQRDNIEKVRSVIRKKRWCKNVHIIESDENKGLADSIIEGVTEIVNKHKKIIVLEDDIFTSVGFLTYMNKALDIYENENEVMQISGYIYPHGYELQESTAFLKIMSCWGWATWSRAWQLYNHNIDSHLMKFNTRKEIKKFNIEGHANFYWQLLANKQKNIYTWAVRWYASCLANNGYTLFPNNSLVQNIGFDNTGEHCHENVNRFFVKIIDNVDVTRLPIQENLSLRKSIDIFFKKEYSQGIKKKTIKILSHLSLYTFLKKTKTAFSLLSNIWSKRTNWFYITSQIQESDIGKQVFLQRTYHISKSSIEDYTYIATNSNIFNTKIGKFCSIGRNFISGNGIHPTNGISTSPMFYSNQKQNGMTLTGKTKIEEFKPVTIGNDVFIGDNVVILSGVNIGDGAVIGAGAIVSKNIPPYAIAVGSPIQIIKYRFSEQQIEDLLNIEWWNLPVEQLNIIEEMFWDIDKFIKKFKR